MLVVGDLAFDLVSFFLSAVDVCLVGFVLVSFARLLMVFKRGSAPASAGKTSSNGFEAVKNFLSASRGLWHPACGPSSLLC